MSPRLNFRAFGASFVLYAALLVGSLTYLQQHHVGQEWATLISLTPMLGGAAVLVTAMRNVRRLDELQRKIWFDALAFASLATALLTFSYGFLENVGFPHASMFIVWPLMGVLQCAGMFVATRRYRA